MSDEILNLQDALSKITFNDQGLVPVVTQEVSSKEVLMLAWMNEESIRKTFADGKVCYWSRSRQELWTKGDTSGNTQRLVEFRLDCDNDAILVLVEQTGNACHTGEMSCFFNKIIKE